MNELGAAVEAMLFHHLVFVEFDRARRDGQRRGDFLGRTAFRQQLQDFSLP
jgi:hypothetical protein